MDRITSKNISGEVFQSLKIDLDQYDFSYRQRINDKETFLEKVLYYSKSFEVSAIYFNSFSNEHSSGDVIACLGSTSLLELQDTDKAFEKIKDFIDRNSGSWITTAFSYDLKNDVEKISSENPDKIGFPEAVLFVPEVIITLTEDEICVNAAGNEEKVMYDLNQESLDKTSVSGINESDFHPNPSRSEYIKHVDQLLEEIKYGNIYEINYCRELYAEMKIDPLSTALHLNKRSPAPFFTYFKFQNKHLICASPERFLLKNGNKLVSQPIKGTRKRSSNHAEDESLKKELLEDKKERGENVMIVDLVRNDLSHTAKRSSVKVTELFGIYTFPHVHQMISSIESELKEEVHFVDAIKHCFPMGSMTGAPKLRAMKLIEEHEHFKRGMFSGSLGLISPSRNFDLNVVIRSIFYDEESTGLSIKTGSAITALCDPEKEWDECVLKSEALLKAIVRAGE